MSIPIRKWSGGTESFSRKKLAASMRSTGAPADVVDRVLDSIEPRLRSGMSTAKLYRLAFDALRREGPHYAGRYGLRRSVMELGPSGYGFEKLWGALLEAQGWSTRVGVRLPGRFVRHEVDVVATRDGRRTYTECKFHNRPGRKTDVKVSLYVYARSLDLQNADGSDFDRFQLVTNTRFTKDALRHGEGVGLEMISWTHPARDGVKDRIERARLHPVTCLTTLTRKHKRQLLEDGVVLARQLADDHAALQRLPLKAARRDRVRAELDALLD